MNPTTARDENEVFNELRTLCLLPGYIHAIAYFSWRDNYISYTGSELSPDDLEHQYSSNRLLRTEISTLIGLLVQGPIDLSIPEPGILQRYINRTEALLEELHHSLTKVWLANWDLKSGILPDLDPFAHAEGLREPIFYGGESAYNFQYRALAQLKYASDRDWLIANKGFDIEDACLISSALSSLLLERLKAHRLVMSRQDPRNWTMLPGFTFSTSDLATSSRMPLEKIEAFLDAFSSDHEERNSTFTSLNEYNATNSAPIFKIAADTFVLLQPYSLLEALYESPFFWMTADHFYSPKALTHRGRFAEDFAADRLKSVFGQNRVYQNLEIYRGKDRVAEIDVLVVYGEQAIVLQAKSKRLTIEARKGNDLSLKADFKKAIQDSYDQALLCSQALQDSNLKFRDSLGNKIEFEQTPDTIFPVCVVSDHYPALGFQAHQFLKATTTASIQSPLISDVFAIDVFVEMLGTPLHFLNYLALRAKSDDQVLVSNEIARLGFHLKQNLWLDRKYNMVNLGDDFASDVDIAMTVRRLGVPGERTPKGILTRYKNLTVGWLLSQLEEAANPDAVGLGLLLLQLSSETAKILSAGIDRIGEHTRRDGRNHDFSLGLGDTDSGITIHCNDQDSEDAKSRLAAHCRVRKYDTKADSWYGVLLSSGGSLRGAMVIKGAWQSDPDMDVVMASWPKAKRRRMTVTALQKKRKIGRNELCPCGSGKKHKKCCLIN